MLDLKFVRDNTEKVEQMLKNRHAKVDLVEFKQLDAKRRTLIQEVEADKSQRNTVSAEISQMKRNGEDATEKITAMRALGEKISATDKELKQVEERLHAVMLTIPNMPAADVPVGKDDTENPEIRNGANRNISTLNRKPIGISVKNWASWIRNGLPRFLVPGSTITKGPVPVWNVRSTISSWTSTPGRTAIRK